MPRIEGLVTPVRDFSAASDFILKSLELNYGSVVRSYARKSLVKTYLRELSARIRRADEGAFEVKATILLISATAISLAPMPAKAQLAPAPGNGQYNGAGYNHSNSGNALGQPGQSCQDLILEGLGATPGNSGSAPGSGSPFDFADTKAGSHYAGSATQNARNSASVSQYDVACLNQH